jgi:hypothetical protein
MTTTRDLISPVRLEKFRPPRSVRAYGFRDGQPIPQEGGPSGFLLSWVALDDEAEAEARGRPSQFVVTGEIVSDGIRHPILAISDAYMKWAGYDRANWQWTRKETP